MNKFLPLIFASLIIYSCVNSASLKDEYLVDIQSKIDINKLYNFKKSSRASAFYNSRNIMEELIDLYNSPKYSHNLDAFFNGINIPEDDHAKLCFLTIALHAKLNNNIIQDDSIVNLCRYEFIKIEESNKKEFLKHVQLTDSMMYLNNSRWFVGDTIHVTLPIKKMKDIEQVTYHRNSLDNYDYSKFIDSISLTGIIIDKSYFTYVGEHGLDTSEVISQLKIIKSSKKEFYFFWEKFHVLDTINFDFGAYGRSIKGAHQGQNRF